ncbi:MAG: hypothetical protein J0M36_03575 [Caulobacterales bacterium]|nr:hypothetical protein [Caulobacterales bacterium]
MSDAEKPMEDRILVEVTVPASYAQVWTAMRDREALANWFGWDADSLADEIEFIFFTHAVIDEEKGVIDFTGLNDRYEVVADGDRTIVRMVRSRPADSWSDVFDGMVEGWISFTWQLAFALGRHAGQQRRTLFLSGPPRQDGLGRLLLGLDAAGAPGEPWSGPLGPEEAAGQVWFVARHQTGVTVDSWGDGLLVAVDEPPTEKKPNGFTMLTLTAYGLSDAAFADLEARWKAWWDARFETVGPGC